MGVVVIPDEGVHLMASAGAPQLEPGRWPMRLADHGSIVTWLKCRGRVYCDTPHRAALDGMCKGCLSLQRTIAGIVLPHEPAPPRYDFCPHCPEPLDPPSYTNSGHPRCGDDSGVDTYEGFGVE